MLFSFWYRALRSCVHQGRSEKRRKPPQRQRARKPWVEVLEDRVAPAVLTVNTLADDIAADNFLSLREAIAVVNSGSTSGLSAAERAQITGSPGSNDTVRFDHSLLGSTQATLALGGGELQLLRDVMIAGPGADRLAISANGRGRVFSIDSTVTASLAGLTIENGYDSIGGGIYSLGSLTVSYCTFAGNSAQGEGGAIDSPDTYTGRLSVANSSFTDNTAGSYGGAISSASTLIVSDTKFSGNSSGLQGGGIYNLGSRIGQEGSLTNVTFTNNQSHWGGAIDNEGVLTVDNSTFSGNTSTADGGAIHNVGTLTVEDNSSFTGNATNVDGGGIANDGQGTLIVSDSSFSGNSAGAGYGYGGGIFNDEYGTLSVSSTVFSNNRAYDGGGIDSWGGDVTVVDSTFSTNTATNNGGGIYNALYTPDTLTVQGGSFTDNAANGGSGGGIYSDGTLILSGTTFSGNYSVSGGSAIANGGTGSSVLLATFSGENLSDSSGAGIANGGTLTINYSTFSDCYADNGGAIANSGTLGVSNSTFAANTAVFWGGAILNGDRGTLTVTNSTLWRNSTTSPFGDGGGIANYGTLTVINSTLSGNSSINGGSGGGIYNSTGGTYSTGTLTLENTIVAGNAAAAGIGPDVYGSVDPGSGFNLIGDGAGMSGISNGDANSNQVGFSGSPIDPGLDPAGLQNNGPGPGSMLTIALVAGSPAIDKGTTTTDLETGQPLTTDQRGLYRSVGAAPDIGAYEYQPPDTTTTLSVSPADSTMVYAGQPVVLTATVRGDAANSNTPTGSVDFADTTTGTDLGSASLVNGVAILATASLPAGPHSLTATYSGFTQGSYQFAGSASSPVNETIAALPSDVSGAGSGIIQANGTPTTTASAAADNQSVGATLSLGTSGQAAGVWVADYTGNPTNPASGNIRIRNSTVSSQGLAYYDVRSSNVSSANTAATLQVTFTLRVASSQVAGLVVAYFDPVAGWSTVNAPSTETLLNNGDGTDNVTITLALSSGTTPAISTLTGTVFVAAFTPTLDYWTNPAGGEWDDAGNWSAGVPGPTDAAIIDIPGQNTFTVTHSAGTDFVYSLTSADALVVSGGTLSITAASAINGAFTIGGALNGTGSLTVTGPLTLEPTATVSNAGGLVADGGATFSTDPVRGGPELERTTLTLHGTSTASPQYWGISVIDGGRLVVAADGTLDVLTSGNLSTSGQGAGYLDNYGRIETHGSGTTTFGMTVTNEPGAVIQADAGTLVLGDGSGSNSYDSMVIQDPNGPGASVEFDGFSTFTATSTIHFNAVTFDNRYSNDPTTVAGTFSAGSTTITYGPVGFTGADPQVGPLTVSFAATADFSPTSGGPVTLTLPSLDLAGALHGTDAVTVTGPLTLEPTATVSNAGGLVADGGATFSTDPVRGGPELERTTLTLHGTSTASPQYWGISVIDGGRLVVAADGTLDVLTSGNLSTSGQGAGYLDNYGRIETHGSGTTTFGMTVTNEPGAVIQADAGTLALGDGDANYYSGRIVGEAGSVVQFYGGFGQEIDGAVNADQVVFTNWPSASDTTVAGSFFAGSTTITYATVHFTGDAPHVGALTVYLGTADFSPAGDTAATLTLDSLSLYGNLMGTDSFVVAGSFTWTGGRLVGPVGSGLTALAGMTLSPAPPSSYIEIDGRTLINPAGQTASFTGGDLFLYEGARLVNQAGALLDLVHGGYIGDNLDGNASLDNAGTIQAQSGGTVQLPLTNEPSALIQADAGTLVLVGRSTYDGTIRQDPNGPGASVEFDYAESFAPTSSVNFNAVTFDNRNDSGTTTVAGSFFAGSTTITYATVHFTGDAPHVGALTLTNYGNNPGYNVADFSPASGPATLTLDSLALAGELAGTDSFVVEGSFTWTGGRLAGPAGSSLTALAGMTLSPAAWNFGLDGRALINPAGQTAFFTGGYWSVYDGAEIDNEGNWEVTGSGVLNDPPGNSGPPALFANDKGGTIDVAVVGGGQVAFDLAFDNNGSITVQAGNTFTMGGGTSSGSFYGVPGSVLSLGGDFTPSSSITGDQVIISGTVAGSYAASTSTSVTWGATFTGSVASVGALSVSEATVDFSPVGQSSVTLDSLDMEHANLTGSADVYVVGLTHLGGWGSSMEGTGTTYAEGGLVYDNTPDSYLLRRLVNEGQALWDNSTVQIEANGTFVNAAGATMVAQGADDWPGYYGTSATFENQGTFVVQGDATQVSFGVPFDNSGTVQIDGGNLSLGLLNEEISGPDQYGQVTVNSSFTLGSALQVSLVNGYAPLSGDTFTIVHPQGTATVTGTFAGLPEGGWLHTATGALQITYQGGAGQDVVLKAFSTQVVNTSDSGPGSLRQAILDANAIPGTDTITFAIPTTDTGYDAGTYTITLASALPALSGDVAISGAGAAQVAISGAGLYQILNVNAGVTASISGLTFEDGAGGEGGAIFNAGNLTLADCALTNNRAGYDGGGIYNDAGTLTMDGDTLTSNSAQNGGAVYNSGGVLAMDGDTFEANPAFNGGGVFIDSGSVTVTTCTFQQNQATTGAGGGIFFNSGTLTVVGSTLSANSAPGYDGGALFVVNGPVSVVNSTFSGNSALFGGGIWSYSAASFTIAGSTFSGNSQTGAGYAAGITNYSGLITLTNSIVANSMGGADLGGYAPFSGSYDLIGDGSNLGELANSLQGNPLLAGLGNYGGSTQTMALLPGSPAINAGTSAGAPVTDQRGYGRVGAVDIGAFESQGFTLRISGGDNQDATVDNPFASPLAVQVTARNPLEPVDGGQVAFTVPGSGASAILSTGDAAISGGKVSVMATANGIGGGYVVSATATGASGVLFSLTNDKATVTTMITSSVNPAVFGQAVTFTASVSAIPPGVPTPTGSVDFVDTTTNTDLGTVSLSGGSASVTISALTAGTHVIEAVYEGNDTYLSSSGTVAQAVNPATPTVSVNAVNLTYGTALANSQLSGTATWIVGSNPVTVAGTFTYTNAAGTILNAGNGQSEAVTFTPTDSTDYTTAPTTVIVNVTKATPTVQVTDAGGTYNQLPFAATATVMGVSGVAGPSLEGVAPTVVYSNASGTQLSGAPVLPGTYTAMATFAGSTDYNTAVSSTVTFTIKTPTTSITGPTIGVPGQPLTYTFAVNGPTQGLTFSINYGDGTSLTTSAGGPTIKLDHLYTATGSFTIQVTATDPNNVTSQLATQTVTIATVEMETDPSGGTALAVGGSAAGRDTITVSATDATGKKLDVKVNKTDYGAFTPTGHILVYGQGGKDTITLKPYVVGNSTYYYIQVPAFLYGEGSGSDKISAAGSAANNVLSGHGNNENLTGGHGRDLLIGGTGSATLNAGTKDDLLIGGWTNYDIFNNTGLNSGTTYDQKLATLDAVMAEWGSSDSYATRLRVLSSSLNTSTVHESSVNGVPVMDSLYGNANTHDWFFASLSDQQNKRVMGTNKDGTDVITTVS